MPIRPWRGIVRVDTGKVDAGKAFQPLNGRREIADQVLVFRINRLIAKRWFLAQQATHISLRKALRDLARTGVCEHGSALLLRGDGRCDVVARIAEGDNELCLRQELMKVS